MTIDDGVSGLWGSVMATDVRVEGYLAVSESLSWLLEHVRAHDYSDEYTRELAHGLAIKHPMPIAECLMALANVKERDYVGLRLPIVKDEDISACARDLLQAIKDYQYSGWPYVRCDKDHGDPSFTDSLNYTLGAIVRVLRLAQRDETIKLSDDLLSEMILVGKKVFDDLMAGFVLLKLDNGGKPIGGWGWTTKADKQPLAVQVYFTSQSLTTIMEALFEPRAFLSAEQEEKALRTAAMAKDYLLKAIVRPEDEKRIGWVDINTSLQSSKDIKYIEAYRRPDEKGGKWGDESISFYPLESLAYVTWYASKDLFSVKKRELEGRYPEAWQEFRSIPEESIGQIEKFITKRFLDSVREEEIQSVGAAKIQLPNWINSDAKATFKNWYIDGTVPHNAVNALLFSCTQFGISASNAQGVAGTLEDQISKLVGQILDASFKNGRLCHTERDDDSKEVVTYSAVYAARTGIATLLSFGIIPPTEPELDVGRVRALVSELASVLGSPPIEPGDPAVAHELSIKAARTTMLAGYALGLLVNTLCDKDKFKMTVTPKDDDGPILRNPKRAAKFDEEEILQKNGVEILEVLARAMSGKTANEIQSGLQKLIEKKPNFLFEPLRTWITGLPLFKDGGNQVVTDSDLALKELVISIESAAENEEERALFKQLNTVRKRLLA